MSGRSAFTLLIFVPGVVGTLACPHTAAINNISTKIETKHICYRYITEMHLLLNSTFYVCFQFLSEYDVKRRLQIMMGSIAYWAVDPTPIIDYLAL